MTIWNVKRCNRLVLVNTHTRGKDSNEVRRSSFPCMTLEDPPLPPLLSTHSSFSSLTDSLHLMPHPCCSSGSEALRQRSDKPPARHGRVQRTETSQLSLPLPRLSACCWFFIPLFGHGSAFICAHLHVSSVVFSVCPFIAAGGGLPERLRCSGSVCMFVCLRKDTLFNFVAVFISQSMNRWLFPKKHL